MRRQRRRVRRELRLVRSGVECHPGRRRRARLPAHATRPDARHSGSDRQDPPKAQEVSAARIVPPPLKKGGSRGILILAPVSNPPAPLFQKKKRGGRLPDGPRSKHGANCPSPFEKGGSRGIFISLPVSMCRSRQRACLTRPAQPPEVAMAPGCTA